jgi:preprotein translocase subunit YajC
MNQAALMNLLPVVLIFVVFYFLLIRPQKKAQEDHRVTLKVDDNVKIEVQKSSIGTVSRKASE